MDSNRYRTVDGVVVIEMVRRRVLLFSLMDDFKVPSVSNGNLLNCAWRKERRKEGQGKWVKAQSRGFRVAQRKRHLCGDFDMWLCTWTNKHHKLVSLQSPFCFLLHLTIHVSVEASTERLYSPSLDDAYGYSMRSNSWCRAHQSPTALSQCNPVVMAKCTKEILCWLLLQAWTLI